MIRRLLLLVVAVAGFSAAAEAVEVKKVVSPGGIVGWLVEDHSVPVLSMRFSFTGGAALDPADKAGRATMVASLLDEGAGDLDAQAFKKTLADLSISLDVNAGRDSVGGTLSTLSEHRQEAFRLLALALTKPRFDPDAVERIRGQMLLNIARRAVEPTSLAWRNFMRLAFEGHPYARPDDGTIETVRALTVEDLRAFHETRMALDNLLVGVAGDISPEQLAPLLDIAFGELPAKGSPTEGPETGVQNAGAAIVVERPVPQSVVVFGHGGVKREDPDWYAALIVDYVLGGGGFTSRLTEEVREKRGLTYGISTGLRPYDHAALFIGQTATQNDRVADSIQIIRGEWRRMAEQGLTEAELADAKTYLTGSFPIGLDSTGRIAAVLVAMQRDNLGIDYLDRRKALIEAVPLAEANRVAKRLLNPDGLIVVVVGQPANLKGNRAPPREG